MARGLNGNNGKDGKPRTDMSDIIFTASISKVYTLVDGGIRVTLDLPENAIMQVAQMLECKRAGAALNVVMTVAEPKAKPEAEEYGGRLK